MAALTSPMNLQVPRRYKRDLQAFVDLPNAERDAVVNAFQQSPPAESVSALVAELSGISGILPTKLEPIVRLLLSMEVSRARTRRPAEEFASDAIETIRNEKDFENVPEEKWNSIHAAIATILSCQKSLRATAKALDISKRGERVVLNSRIISDIRPVFGDDVEEKPTHAVIVHTLRLECHNELQHHHFLVSADALTNLKATIERALAKQAALSDLVVSGLELTLFDDGEDA